MRQASPLPRACRLLAPLWGAGQHPHPPALSPRPRSSLLLLLLRNASCSPSATSTPAEQAASALARYPGPVCSLSPVSSTHASLDPARPLSRRALGLGQECGACSALGQPQGFPSHRGGKRLAPLSTVPRAGRSFFSTCQSLRTEGNSALLGGGDFPS